MGGIIAGILLKNIYRTDSLNELRKIEFPRFFQNAKKEKASYFAQLLDGAFIYNIIQVDSATLEIVKDNFKNYFLFLDTNILYSLLELADPKRASSIEKTLRIANQYGMNIIVSPKTLEELKRSIDLKTELLLKSPEIRQDLADIGADLSEEENFITAYWRAYSKPVVTML